MQKKLLGAFLIVGLVPFVIVYLYLIFYADDKITQNILSREFENIQSIISASQDRLMRADKELLFLSKLDVIDDVIVDDIDKRVARLLLQKKRDMHAQLEFIIIDPSFNFITSSKEHNLQGHYKYYHLLQEAEKKKQSFFIQKHKLIFYTKLYSSFNHKFLGYMLLEYDLNNLGNLVAKGKNIYGYFFNAKNQYTIGEHRQNNLSLQGQEGSLITEKNLIVYKQLNLRYLKDWYYVNVIKKEKALDFLYDFIHFMSLMFPIAVLLIIFVSFVSAKKIIRPLQKLTENVLDITRKKDYKRRIDLDAKDEIAKLSDAFNELLLTNKRALEKLETENKVRLKRFIELVTVFNAIIQTKTETECIELFIEKIHDLTDDKPIDFEKKKSEGVQIYVTNFEKNTKECYGTLIFNKEAFSENEVRFFTSIATMISLQLERIRLINATMQASRAKSAFISNMSHELRTPLNAIIGFTQYLITYEQLNEEQMEIVGNIENSASYLLEMINGILDIAKIEAGKMELHYEMVDIKELLFNIVSMLTPLAEQKNLTISLDMQGYIGENVLTDPYFVKQIIINLLSNAIKFTDKGGIKICMKTVKSHYIQLSISDTGIGIEAKDLDKLFQDFTQLDHKVQKKYKGTGLGLSISKKLAKLLQGDLQIHSAGIEKGSRAILSLPI